MLSTNQPTATLQLDTPGSRAVTRAQVEAIPVPKSTHSWRPVPYAEVIRLVETVAYSQLGLTIADWQFGLNKAGDQMFGCAIMRTEHDDMAQALGVRQSYNKSLALGVAIGAKVFVCSNLCFSGSAFKVVRKNTLNVIEDFRGLLHEQLAGAQTHYTQLRETRDRMEHVQVSTDRGFMHLGVMVGRKLLSANQASIAFSEWRAPRHAEFSERTMWSLYNSCTQGLKKGGPGGLLDRHAKVHDHFAQMVHEYRFQIFA